MKKLLLLLIMPFVAVNILFAEHIDATLASLVGKNFYMQSIKSKSMAGTDLTLVYTEQSRWVSNVAKEDAGDFAVFYVYNVNHGDGFVIVSADDDVTPVLGYTTSGSFDPGSLPPALRKMLDKYKKEILDVISNGLQGNSEIASRWENLGNGLPLKPSRDSKAVSPLLATTWNQSPYENEMCPADAGGPGGHCVTGCPATAMTQIMKYWSYPPTGTGFHSYNTTYGTLSADFAGTTYDWGAMPAHLNSSNDAVALIMYHTGVAVEMTYGPDGSYGWVIENDNQGSHPVCCEVAYKTYFGYATTMQGSVRADHNDAEWKQMLETDLDAGRPVQYAGFGSAGGHTWVCDGYDNQEYFHMNWGWGGSGDGYYYLDALNLGTASFNSNQQALFGIQPSQTTTTTLQMYSAITINPDPIPFGQGFTVNADLLNAGTTTFNGEYCAALFDSQGNFIDFVETLTGASLPPNFHYPGGLTFTSQGIAGATPGNYMIGIYSRPAGGGWGLVAAATFTNPVDVTIEGASNDISLYSSISLDHTPVLVNEAFTATADIANLGTTDFSGTISLDLHSFDGTWMETIQEYTGITLSAGYYYTKTFSTTGLNVDPGSYYLVVWDKPDGGDWKIVSSGSYSNPIQVVISDQPLNADSYEPDNSEAAAYPLTLSFSGNTATCNTNGSNLGTGTDVDYYKLEFSSGYDYNINARVHDSYSSGNGETYTGDVIFSYKSGAAWSDYFDDVMPSDIFLQNGGTLIFVVSPYYEGQMGTYLLDVNVTKNPTGIENVDKQGSVRVFPNPASEKVTFLINNDRPQVIKATISNIFGQKVMEVVNGTYSAGEQKIIVDAGGLAPGCYFYQAETGDRKTSGKLVITR